MTTIINQNLHTDTGVIAQPFGDTGAMRLTPVDSRRVHYGFVLDAYAAQSLVCAILNAQPVPESMSERMRDFAVALEPMADAAASLHHDLVREGKCGTGVTAPMSRELATIADNLRELARLHDFGA